MSPRNEPAFISLQHAVVGKEQPEGNVDLAQMPIPRRSIWDPRSITVPAVGDPPKCGSEG